MRVAQRDIHMICFSWQTKIHISCSFHIIHSLSADAWNGNKRMTVNIQSSSVQKHFLNPGGKVKSYFSSACLPYPCFVCVMPGSYFYLVCSSGSANSSHIKNCYATCDCVCLSEICFLGIGRGLREEDISDNFIVPAGVIRKCTVLKRVGGGKIASL